MYKFISKSYTILNIQVVSVENNKKIPLKWFLLHVIRVKSLIYNVFSYLKYSNKENV